MEPEEKAPGVNEETNVTNDKSKEELVKAPVNARVRELSRNEDANRPNRSRSVSSLRMGKGKESSEMENFVSPRDIPDSPEMSPVTYRPSTSSRTHSLRYTSGALHGSDQPTSFDHNFDSLPVQVNSTKAKSSSPPRRPLRRRRNDSPSDLTPAPEMTVTHLSRQLPPLVRVQADLAAENGSR